MSTQVVLVQILFPTQQVLDIVISYPTSTCIICNVHLNLVGDLQMHQPSLNCNDVKNILKLDPFELFCAT